MNKKYFILYLVFCSMPISAALYLGHRDRVRHDINQKKIDEALSKGYYAEPEQSAQPKQTCFVVGPDRYPLEKYPGSYFLGVHPASCDKILKGK